MSSTALAPLPADGGTELTLVHEVSPEWADRVEEGWTAILDDLARVLGEPVRNR